MKFYPVLLIAVLVPLVWCQDDDELRGLHKKKRRPYNQQGGPCGGFRDAGPGFDQDGRSLKLVAALGGAAVGYHLGMKYQQQPVINNIITTGGGNPCGGIVRPPIINGGGLIPFGGNPLLGNPLLGNPLGGLAGLGSSRNGVNWNRTVRQFNREIVRPLTRWFK